MGTHTQIGICTTKKQQKKPYHIKINLRMLEQVNKSNVSCPDCNQVRTHWLQPVKLYES